MKDEEITSEIKELMEEYRKKFDMYPDEYIEIDYDLLPVERFVTLIKLSLKINVPIDDATVVLWNYEKEKNGKRKNN